MITYLKRVTVLALVLISMNAMAQVTIKAGLTSADVSLKDNSGALDQFNKAKKGMHFGIFKDKEINNLLSFETGLMFDQKGMKQVADLGSGDTMTTILNIAYLQLPVALKIGVDVTDDVRIFGKIGAYGAYGLSGKINTELVASGVPTTSETDLNIGNDVAAGDQIKPIDFGGNVGVGVAYKKLSFEVDLGMGLANIATNTSSGENFKNKDFKFTLGYRFGK